MYIYIHTQNCSYFECLFCFLNFRAAILFLITSEERNIFDQRWLEYGVFKCNPTIPILRMTYQDIYDQGHVDEDNNLIVLVSNILK